MSDSSPDKSEPFNFSQEALDAASREVHMMLLREGSSWGTKACEEMGRTFMVSYHKATRSSTQATGGSERFANATTEQKARMFEWLRGIATKHPEVAPEWFYAGLAMHELNKLAATRSAIEAHRPETRRTTLPALPGQKPLTFLMQRDESDKQADAMIAALQRGDTTFVPTPISELFFHQLRLRVAQDPTLADKIGVYYLTADQNWQEVGLLEQDELKWPVGFCHEAWEKEIEIKQVRHAAHRAEGGST